MNTFLRIRSILIASFALFLFASPALAQSQRLTQDQTVNNDYYGAGETVTVSGIVNGDAYISGGTVIIDGTINGDAMIAGGSITINGEVTQDLRVAGGNITINGPIKRNLTVAGGDVQIGKSGSVAGNVLGFFGNLQQYGSIGGSTRLFGGKVGLEAPVGGNVDAKVGKLSLGESAKIEGNLIYTSEDKAELAPNATIAGTVDYTKSPMEFNAASRRRMGEQAGKAWTGFKAASAILDFITAAIIGLLLLRLIPTRMLHMTEIVKDQTMKAWLIGAGTLIIAPVLMILLLVTIVGIPLSILLFFGLLTFSFFAKIPVVYYIGRYITDKMNNGERRGWAYIAGLLVYILVTMLPLVGWIAKLIVLPLGIGTLLLEKKYFYNILKEKKLL